MKLEAVFGPTEDPEVTIVRRPFTPMERVELHKRLIRATAAGSVPEVRELLKEGAQVNFEPVENDADASLSLSHWEEGPGGPADQPAAPEHPSQGDAQAGEQQPAQEEQKEEEEDEDEDEDEEAEGGKGSNDKGVEPDKVLTHPCGGLTPLLVALAAGHQELAGDFRQLGAKEADLEPSAAGGLPEAFARKDFPDVARHLARGTDLNVRMQTRTGGLALASSYGVPLHVCAALHRLPGAFETAQLLVRLRADLNAGDAEGDSPLAHARYYGAREIHALYEGSGALLLGPFYGRRR